MDKKKLLKFQNKDIDNSNIIKRLDNLESIHKKSSQRLEHLENMYKNFDKEISILNIQVKNLVEIIESLLKIN